MKCLRCGHCCFFFTVGIVKKESLDKISNRNDLIFENIKNKEQFEFCEHLTFNKETKEFNCSIHNYPWFKFTPCYEFTQIEDNEESLCRIGEWYQNEGKDYYESNIMKKWRECETKTND